MVRLRASAVQSVGAAEKKWMEFFDDPNAYWDNRQNKRNPRAPDFKHKDEKDTVLWLDSRDTPSCEPTIQSPLAMQNICSVYRMIWGTSFKHSTAISLWQDWDLCTYKCIEMHALRSSAVGYSASE